MFTKYHYDYPIKEKGTDGDVARQKADIIIEEH
jgi:hypothetical protein